jgi:hypothetical protein
MPRFHLLTKAAIALASLAVGSVFAYSRIGETSRNSTSAQSFQTDSAGGGTQNDSPNLGSGLRTTGSAEADFQDRCHSPEVIRCIGFDTASDIAGSYGDNSGILPGAAVPKIDSVTKASGSGSLRFEIPPKSGADTSGTYFTNFSKELAIQFSQNAEFYVQWRQRFSSEFLNTIYKGGEGWKQAIIGTGDQPGHPYPSCTALEIVVQNTYQRGFAQLYNSCTGSSSHGAYLPFQENYGGADFKLQNARPAPFCLYSQGRTDPPTFFPPKGDCFGYFPNEWMTFQLLVKTGPRVKDEFTNSRIQLWIARERQASQLVINWGPYNLSAGDVGEGQKFGKVWLLPYHTNKDPNQVTPTAYVWYDELIISRAKIPDPQ